MERRLGHDREIELPAAGQRFYDPREDTDFLYFFVKFDERDDAMEEKHGIIYDCATNELLGLEGILDKIFLN